MSKKTGKMKVVSLGIPSEKLTQEIKLKLQEKEKREQEELKKKAELKNDNLKIQYKFRIIKQFD
jgi:hypothetical protein